ncbi:efflux RND transporter periplasmic adaptor subunit [Novosphingobium sp. Chol11]|uniref:efflux RND transporter periplasmic adaptor subunit n=1 Tax=Novosphingobium sp. Chol11 TaxID=1385763 RepID=UPI0025D5E70B|nr:efflux RND transporter periplasmic adaptor subunit [Novosphingobium sp. Chol11]
MNYETSIQPSEAAPFEVSLTQDAHSPGPDGRRRAVAAILALIVMVLGAVWYFTQGSPTGAKADAAKGAQAQTVSVIQPGRVTVQGTIETSGTLAARREMPVGAAGDGGRVVRVLVDAGDWVRAGQVLAVVDRAVQAQQIAGQAANIEVQRANARLAQSNLDRAVKLVEKGFISKADIDRLTATRDAEVAQVRVATATLEQIRASTARLDIVAPAAGLVLSRGVEPGQIVGPGSGVLFRIARDGELEMQARLGESDLARLSVGVPAEVLPVGTAQSYTGQIWQLAPTIDAQTREGMARIALAYSPALRPGGFASAKISSGSVLAPVLPESAILSDRNGSFVFVVVAKNKVERRAVKLGEVTAQGIVVSQGLSGDERVVMRAGGFLNAGDSVRPVLVKQASAASPQGS